MNIIGLNTLANDDNFANSQPGLALKELPLGFIDIGARGGAHDLVEPIAKYTAVLGFEPDESECQRLMQNPAVYQPWADFVLEPVALADKKGPVELKLLSANTNHSLLSPNVDFTHRYNMQKWQEIGACELFADTLDNCLAKDFKSQARWGEFIKLDTQGTEFEILQGATQVLQERTVAVITEVAFCELYKGQKLFSDVETLLRQHGFSFYGFTTLHTRSKKYLDKQNYVTRERIIYSDAIFFKDPLPGGYANKTNARANYSLFTIALLLGFYDFAYELAQETWLIMADKIEVNRIEQLIKTLANLSPQQTTQALFNLTETVKQNPAWANVAVGGFIDRRRHFCDYDDVLNVSPLPKTL